MGKNQAGGVVRAPARGGYTLVELTVAVMVLAITLGAICSSLLTTVSLSRTNHQTAIGLDAAASRIEAMRGEVFEEVFARYNATTADDPATGVSPGSTFDVPGLRVRPNDPDGFVGEIQFPGDGVVLIEQWNDPGLGMPRDLNNDGDSIDTLNSWDDYTVLPVRVVLEWRGPGTDQRIEIVTTLSWREEAP